MEVLDKMEALRARASSQRQATWNRIKREAPDVAELLTEINQAFGKPEAVRVTIRGEVVLDKGEYLPRKHWQKN